MVSLNITQSSANNFGRKISKLTWRSTSINPQNNGDLNHLVLHRWSKFGDSSFNRWCVMGWKSSKWGKFGLLSQIWPWRSRSIAPQKNRVLNQGLLHLLSKFRRPSSNRWWVIARTSKWLIHTHTDWHTHRQTHTHTDTQTQPMTIPEGQNWPRVKSTLGP